MKRIFNLPVNADQVANIGVYNINWLNLKTLDDTVPSAQELSALESTFGKEWNPGWLSDMVS